MPCAFGAFLISGADLRAPHEFDSTPFSDSLLTMQLDLFTSALETYLNGVILSNDNLFGQLIEPGARRRCGPARETRHRLQRPIKEPTKRRVTWLQYNRESQSIDAQTTRDISWTQTSAQGVGIEAFIEGNLAREVRQAFFRCRALASFPATHMKRLRSSPRRTHRACVRTVGSRP